MASVIETTAVSLRKGDTESNREFVGVLGEVTVDLGNEANGTLGVDTNVTLRIHNGINKGGVPLARADMRNITTAALAENRDWFDDKNLAYADLSNIEECENPEAIEIIKNTLSSYGLVNTTDLEAELELRALRDMSNVLTSTLASGRGRGENGNLAYADSSNINTADLTSNIIHDGTEEGDLPLAYANASNIDTTNLTLESENRPTTMSGPTLARSDLINISKENWQDTLFNPDNELYLERTINKIETIPDDLFEIPANSYPSASATNLFVKDQIEKGDFLKSNYVNSKTYYPLYSNSQYYYKLNVPTDGVITGGTNFIVGSQYYVEKSLDPETYLMGFVVTEAKDYVTDIQPIVCLGKENLGMTNITFSKTIDGIKQTITAELHAEQVAENLYKYNLFILNENLNFKGQVDDILYPDEDITLTRIITITPIEVDTDTGAITNYKVSPEYSTTIISSTDSDTSYTFTLDPSLSNNGQEGTNAQVTITVTNAISGYIGGAGLAKTNLTNLLGMSEKDANLEENTPWRIRHAETIVNVSSNITEAEYYNIANNGQVHDALVYTKNYIEQTSSVPNWKANTEYVITPYPSKVLYNGDIYYCITAHTSSTTFDATNWKLLSENTFEKLANKNSNISLDTTSEIKYPTNKAVVDYVKEQIEAVHTPGHYYGQVNIFVNTENNLPGNSDPSTEYTIDPYEGLTALVQNYNNTNEPAIATYTNNAWTYKEVALQNGVYVYILNLGSSYYNGPGNATWNDEDKVFDIAPDKFQVPDGITLNLNDSTGAIQIVPALQTKLSYVDVDSSIQTTIDDIYSKLNNIDANLTAMVIPSPQFFTGTGITNQQLVLTDNVAFDLYVNGVFQYPNTYAFDTETKTITLNFAVENTSENGIAVIYRGFRTLQP